jgi:hypothetical protein
MGLLCMGKAGGSKPHHSFGARYCGIFSPSVVACLLSFHILDIDEHVAS